MDKGGGSASSTGGETNGDDASDTRRTELVRLGAERDGVELVEYRLPPEARGWGRWAVAACWLAAAAFGIGTLVVFFVWPYHYVAPGEDGHWLYVLYNPIFGTFLGLTVLAMSAAFILTAKHLLPKEVAVEQRHLGTRSSKADRETFAATIDDATEHIGLRRRSLLGRSMAAGVGVFGITAGVVGLSGFVRDPWDGAQAGKLDEDTLWHTDWWSPNGETVYLRLSTNDPLAVELVRPEDIGPGEQIVVYPFRESHRHDEEQLAEVLKKSDNPVTLYRLHPDTDVVDLPEREGMNYGDFYAYSRVCTHLGCPVGMFEAQLHRAMCPCHQSQFDLTQHAKPVFGPATRSLPQLPIALDADGFFVALGDFTGPAGPSFWEHPN